MGFTGEKISHDYWKRKVRSTADVMCVIDTIGSEYGCARE